MRSPVADRLCAKIDQALFERLTEGLDGSRARQYAIDGVEPELLFTREPGVYPLFVDLGDERFAVEVDVTVWKVKKGSLQDLSCSEAEAYAAADGEGKS